MKNLILIRHAKSSWDAPLHDKDRPITSQGIDDAHLVSSKIASLLPKSYIIWCSTGKRAMETATIFAQNLSYPLESIVFKEELYTFDVHQLEKVIQSCPSNYENVIIFGHNGAITDFVNKFGDRYIDNVSTAGVVCLRFDAEDWQTIQNGVIQKTVFPKDLK
jgi:phosphohistidine phosphatase